MQALQLRAFNPGHALTVSLELPDYSGDFEVSTEVFSDTLERDAAIFHDEFGLMDGAPLISLLSDSKEELTE
jgi:hypothetical protein